MVHLTGERRECENTLFTRPVTTAGGGRGGGGDESESDTLNLPRGFAGL